MSNETVESHVYHHQVREEGIPTINVTLTKNSKGVNVEVTINGAHSPEEAANLIKETLLKVKKEAEALQPEEAV